MGSAARKSTEPTTDPLPTGAMIPQPHGGAIRNGGTNRGGHGRPASKVRAALLRAGAKRIPVLQAIADDPTQGAAERIRAVNVMLTHGLDDKSLTLGSVQERILQTAELLRSTLPPELYEAIAPRLRAIWNAT
jgi:hypothetical protein